ncbi:MAG: hypothetical protein ACI8ZN_001611, partial [Bacteroidia bacterium]
ADEGSSAFFFVALIKSFEHYFGYIKLHRVLLLPL